MTPVDLTDLTGGGAALTTTNCMVTATEAAEYFALRLHADAWDDATPTDQVKALVQGTREINGLTFQGSLADPDQAHAFPRVYQARPHERANRRDFEPATSEIEDATIPLAVKWAVCEQAIFLLALTPYERDRKRQHAAGIIGGGVGKANEYSNAGFVNKNQQGPTISPDAMQLLNQWLARVVNLE